MTTTDLSLSKDSKEGTLGVVPNSPRYNDEQRAHCIKGRGPDKHCGDGHAQSTDPSYPHSSANVPGVQDKTSDDHEGEEDVERDRDRKVWKTEINGGSFPDTVFRPRRLVGVCDADRYVNNISLGAAACLRRTQMRTDGAEIHKAGEGDNPEVCGIDYMTTIELEKEPVL